MPQGDVSNTSRLHCNDLHQEFRSLVMLDTLVSAVNNRGRPNFQDCTEPYQGALERSMPTRNKIQTAVSILLSRNAEIIAVAVKDPSTQQDFYHLWAVQQDLWNMKYPEVQGNCILLNSGKSHFASVEFHEWDSLFTIP